MAVLATGLRSALLGAYDWLNRRTGCNVHCLDPVGCRTGTGPILCAQCETVLSLHRQRLHAVDR